MSCLWVLHDSEMNSQWSSRLETCRMYNNAVVILSKVHNFLSKKISLQQNLFLQQFFQKYTGWHIKSVQYNLGRFESMLNFKQVASSRWPGLFGATLLI